MKKTIPVVLVILLSWAVFIGFMFAYPSIRKDPIGEELGASSRTPITVYPSREMFIYHFEGETIKVPMSKYNINYDTPDDERLYVYLDDKGKILDFTIVKDGEGDWPIILAGISFPVLVIGLLLFRYVIAKRTIGKAWYSYLEWYLEEIDPYRGHPHFAEIERQASIKKLTLKN